MSFYSFNNNSIFSKNELKIWEKMPKLSFKILIICSFLSFTIYLFTNLIYLSYWKFYIEIISLESSNDFFENCRDSILLLWFLGFSCLKRSWCEIFLQLIFHWNGVLLDICTAVIFLFWDAAKKSFSRFPHIRAIMPFLKICKFFNSNLYFFRCLKISLKNYELFRFDE